ncbi:MAG: hypothetical protein CBC35_00095 [Planctomycetes bacterium TMED75]|nr:hypothetical protein [Planctomycetaceae bacterium]OUU96932.1 MAG: hypothetical protein CBC35_00095 [Planctomycetes bacterium TMED75]
MTSPDTIQIRSEDQAAADQSSASLGASNEPKEGEHEPIRFNSSNWDAQTPRERWYIRRTSSTRWAASNWVGTVIGSPLVRHGKDVVQ